MRKQLTATMITSALLLMCQPSFAATSSYTTEEAIQRYQLYYDDYVKDELGEVEQYRSASSKIKGSLADQLIERAIWYMENGYMVYGDGWMSYHTDGIVNCSEFTKLVFGDFNFKLTDIASQYDKVGIPVPGISAKKTSQGWMLEGTENLLPGDILTWWKDRSDGTRYIAHVGIYMGQLNGQPAVIETSSGKELTAIGIKNSFKYWYGEHFFSAQRILPEGSWSPGKTIVDHEAKMPVIPQRYVLPPQKPIVLPEGFTPSEPKTGSYIATNRGWVSVFSKPSLSSTITGRLELGEEAPMIQKHNDWWYEIRFHDSIGYITTNSVYTRLVNY
ncbi:SH3 domain-containing protein [Ammoniphilus sp. CFH 90114]|uniref:SH3 domain-containing protein n=1 Tax=Ammoniphilus sp. CFH 90114 TaxID=2493665 RepID=UPI00196B9D8C|nr:SH3 domain-containing protein [Ammoniphilus sp. CFH 90114]